MRWVIVFTVVLVLAHGTYDSVSAESVFTDPQGRISLTIPNNFVMDATRFRPLGNSYGTAFFAQSKPLGVILLTITPDISADPNDLPAFVLGSQVPSEIGNGYTIVPDSLVTTMFGGRSAVRWEFIQTIDGNAYRGLEMLTIIDRTSYSLAIESGESDFAAFVNVTRIAFDSYTFQVNTSARTFLRRLSS